MNEILLYTSGDARETGKYMHQMVEEFYSDMAPYAHLSLVEIFDKIKSIPFRYDLEPIEVLQRPKYTMSSQGYGGDCDCKAIALASYCRLVGLPYKFLAVRRPGKKSLHHVVCLCYISGRWIFADPSYSFNQLGRKRELYEQEVLI